MPKNMSCLFAGLPGIRENVGTEELTKLLSLSRLWQLEFLESICDNEKKYETHLNPSIGALHNAEMGQKLRLDFLETQRWANVSFTVEGRDSRIAFVHSQTRVKWMSLLSPLQQHYINTQHIHQCIM